MVATLSRCPLCLGKICIKSWTFIIYVTPKAYHGVNKPYPTIHEFCIYAKHSFNLIILQFIHFNLLYDNFSIHSEKDSICHFDYLFLQFLYYHVFALPICNFSTFYGTAQSLPNFATPGIFPLIKRTCETLELLIKILKDYPIFLQNSSIQILLFFQTVVLFINKI